MDDPNINPAWDALLGEDTAGAVFRMIALVVGFVAVGGTAFWLAG